MGLRISPDIFQEKMSKLMTGLEFARAYPDNFLLITKGNFNKHLEALDTALIRLF